MRRSMLAVPVVALLSVAVTAPPAQAKTPYTVTATVSDSSIEQGDTVTVSGKVSKGTTSLLKIYLKQGASGWSYKGSVKPAASGAFTTGGIEPVYSGPASIKIVKPASSTYSEGSKTVTVKVFGWVPLSKLPGKVTEAGASSFGGWTAYLYDDAYVTPKALRMRASAGSYDARVRFDLMQQCTKLFSDYGLDASAHHDELAQVRWFTRPGTSTAQTATLGPIHQVVAGSPGHDESVSILAGSVRPRQLVIAAQMEHPTDLFGYDAAVLCNLPGAAKTTYGD